MTATTHRMPRRYPLLLLLGVLLLAPQERAQSDDHRLDGSWLATVTVTDPPGFAEIQSLQTYMPTGTVIESRRPVVTNTAFGTLIETAAHGAWVRTDRRRYSVAVGFLVQGTQDNLAYPGLVLGVDNIRLDITLGDNDDTYTGTFSSELRDANDQILYAASGTIAGRRIKVDR